MRFAVVVLILLLASVGLRAEDVPQPALAEGKCSIPADEHWKPQEQFVWRRVCLGNEANFNIEPGYGGDLDPKEPAGLPDSRILRSTFLATILLSDGYRHALTNRGVRIVGARFTENVDLQNAQISSELWLDRSLFEQGADFRGLRSTRRITLYGSKFTARLRMSGMEIRGDLSAHNADFNALDLSGTHIDGDLVLSGSAVTDLDMVSLQGDKNVFMDEAQFGQVNLTSARAGRLFLDNSRVAGELNMTELQVDGDLLMHHAKYVDVLLSLAQVHGVLILANTEVTGNLVMFGVHVDGDLQALNANIARVSLGSAEVHGSVALIGATVAGDLDMSGLRVGRDLILSTMSVNDLVPKIPEPLKGSLEGLGVADERGARPILKATFGNVSLAGSEVKRGLSLIGTTVNGTFGMDGAQIGADLTMVNGKYQEVSLERARISGVVNLRGSKVAGQLDCIASEIRGRFDLSGDADFAGPINCRFAKIRELDLAGGSFRDNVDLTGTQISGELRVGSAGEERARWAENSTLYLSNATADAIQDSQDSWPNRIDLSGFTYRSLGGHQATRQDQMASRPVIWLANWLGKQNPYAPAPYEQLATVLRNHGRPGDADEILYAGRERERLQAVLPRRAWLATMNLLIGYGYHMERALFWVAGFLVAGIAVLRFSNQGPKNFMPFGIAYSFDMLLPIIRLRERHYQVDLQGWPRYYFYVHKIMGYVLASFLIAGLAGISK